MSQESANDIEESSGSVLTTSEDDQIPDAENVEHGLDIFDIAAPSMWTPEALPGIADQTEAISDQSPTDPEPEGPVDPLDYVEGSETAFRPFVPGTHPERS